MLFLRRESLNSRRTHYKGHSAVAARLTTWQVPRASTLSPLMRLSGQSPIREAKFRLTGAMSIQPKRLF